MASKVLKTIYFETGDIRTCYLNMNPTITQQCCEYGPWSRIFEIGKLWMKYTTESNILYLLNRKRFFRKIKKTKQILIRLKV